MVKGAAIYAEGLRGEATGEVVRELPKVRKVLPRSFGVRLDRETSLHREHLYIEYIANANDPLPIAERRLVACTKIDNVETQSFHFFEQNGDVPSPVIALNREVTPPDGFVFRGLPKLRKGSPDHHHGERRRGRSGDVEAYEDKSGQRLETNVQLGVLQEAADAGAGEGARRSRIAALTALHDCRPGVRGRGGPDPSTARVRARRHRRCPG